MPVDHDHDCCCVVSSNAVLSDCCFNCGEKGHFIAACPYPKKRVAPQQVGKNQHSVFTSDLPALYGLMMFATLLLLKLLLLTDIVTCLS